MEVCGPGVLTLDPVGESQGGELLKHQCRAPPHTPRALIHQVGRGVVRVFISRLRPCRWLRTAALDHCFSTFLKTCLFDKRKTQCFSS